MRYERNIHANDAEASLRLPSDLPMEGYDYQNWKFTELSPSARPGAVYRLRARCTLSGWERLGCEWYAAEADIMQYGEGDTTKWKEYVEKSFALILLSKKVEKIKVIQEALKTAFERRKALQERGQG